MQEEGLAGRGVQLGMGVQLGGGLASMERANKECPARRGQ